jgi:hypothetical protein
LGRAGFEKFFLAFRVKSGFPHVQGWVKPFANLGNRHYHDTKMSLHLRWYQNPRVLTCLVAALVAFVAQSGELGSSDTTHRLQTTHSFWTSEPPVFPDEYPEFGVHGRGGRLYGWYGIGQSLLMLPTDIVGTWIERIPIFSDYDGTDPSVRDIFVTYTTEILFAIATVTGILSGTIGFRSTCTFILHDSPALHAEHDGKQLHPAADADRVLLSMCLGENGKKTGPVDWIGGVWAELADAAYDGT